MKRNFIREKKIYCGTDYMEIDIYPRTRSRNPKLGTRSKKEKVSAPKQRNLNDKNAKRYFTQLANTNFREGDLHVTATYTKDNLPDTPEEAEKEVANFLRRIAYRRGKEGLLPLKYILVTEYSMGKGGTKPIRIHHHIIMNAGLDRDTVENLWRKRKPKGEKQGEKIGFVNADRLQPDEYGLEALCQYLTKKPKGKNGEEVSRTAGKRRWSCSQNLEKPQSRNNDYSYTQRQVERIAKEESDNQSFWWKRYPGWILTECKPAYNEITGWAIYLKLRRLNE